uniref:Tripeptidyl-peptidase 2 isoform X2 n=1 Tax=Rhizophora mucronata TaxID=61149 RepID=A0A2P2LLV1_RHIMU
MFDLGFCPLPSVKCINSCDCGVNLDDLLHRAHEYMQQCRSIPCVCYEIKINQCGKATPTLRGIYLREAIACQQPTEWTVQVEPRFHEGASNLEELVPFEECIELHSSEKAVVRTPEYLLLTHNGRSFNIVVDPTKLSHGLHYFEVCGIDCKAPWRGAVFRIPITITKPMSVNNRPPIVSFPKLSFLPGHIERRYIEVPYGASWVEANMLTSGFDTTRRFFVDTVQICPLQRPIKWESVVTFSSPAAKSFAFPVVGGQTMELAVAQFWSSGIGSHETTVVDFEVVFHGIDINKEEIMLDGSEAPVRIDVEALLASEKLKPAAMLNNIRVPYRPVDAKLGILTDKRDKLPSGKQTLTLTLTYRFKLENAAKVKPQIPLLNNRIYDNKFESQFYMISDANKRVYAMGDVYPKSTKLPKGEYNLQLYLRHDNVQYLEKMKQLVLFIERKLDDKDVIWLNFFSEPDGPVMGNGAYESSTLVPGKKEAIYLGPPVKDKLPKNAPQGSVLLGSISYGKLSSVRQEGGNPPVSYQVSYVVPPSKVEEDKGKNSSSTSSKAVSERIEEEVRDAKIRVLGSLKQDNDEECLEWKTLSSSLKSDYPRYTPLLAKILEGLLSQSNFEDKVHHDEEVVDAANEVIDSIDRDELARFFSVKSDPEDEEAQAIKKKMETTRDQLAEALYQKGLALADIESLKGEKAQILAATEGTKVEERTDTQSVTGQSDLFEENFKELQKWVDVKSSKYGTLTVLRERRHGRHGTALKVLNDMIQEEGDPPKKKFYELKLSLLDEIGWSHLATYERQWMHVRFPKGFPLF